MGTLPHLPGRSDDYSLGISHDTRPSQQRPLNRNAVAQHVNSSKNIRIKGVGKKSSAGRERASGFEFLEASGAKTNSPCSKERVFQVLACYAAKTTGLGSRMKRGRRLRWSNAPNTSSCVAWVMLCRKSFSVDESHRSRMICAKSFDVFLPSFFAPRLRRRLMPQRLSLSLRFSTLHSGATTRSSVPQR